MTWPSALLLMAALAGCPPVDVEEDAGEPEPTVQPEPEPDDDGGAPDDDAGAPDNDAGAPDDDAGAPDDDAGTPGDDAGTPDDDAGTTDDDAGTPDDDAGTPDDDAGTPDDDAGTPVDDAGTPVDDAGTPDDDAGTLDDDAGTPDDDAGTPDDDAGAPDDDAGAPVGDAGAPVDDAGTPVGDAGVMDGGLSDAGVDDAGVVCEAPTSPPAIEFAGPDFMALMPFESLYLPGAAGSPADAFMMTWDDDHLYVVVRSSSFIDPPNGAFSPLHLYVEVDPDTPPESILGKEYSGQVPVLSFDADFVIAARPEPGYSALFADSQGPFVDEVAPVLSAFTLPPLPAGDLAVVVPWHALGCPSTVRMQGHVVFAQPGAEWRDTVPAAHTPWATGDAYWEFPVDVPPAPVDTLPIFPVAP